MDYDVRFVVTDGSVGLHLMIPLYCYYYYYYYYYYTSLHCFPHNISKHELNLNKPPYLQDNTMRPHYKHRQVNAV